MIRGRTILLLGMVAMQAQPVASTQASAADWKSCVYVSKPTRENPAPQLEPHVGCSRIGAGGELELDAGHLARMDFAENGLAAVLAEGDWHYVDPTGRSLRVITYDNGADHFSEGLVRGLRDGKMAYFNSRFEEVVPAEYDWGWPFENGRALVCSGCVLGESDGEHRPVVDGRWGFIAATGKEVVPVQLSRPEALGLRGPLLLVDFPRSTEALPWFVVNDDVMGGRSEGGFRLEGDVLIFAGSTNTRGGGFSSIRSRPHSFDLAAYDGVRLRARGDGRTYTFRLTTWDTRDRRRRPAYWAEFETGDGTWKETDVPFTRFRPRWRGAELPGPALEPAAIDSLGLMINDGQDGPFRLEVDWISAYREVEPSRAPHP